MPYEDFIHTGRVHEGGFVGTGLASIGRVAADGREFSGQRDDPSEGSDHGFRAKPRTTLLHTEDVEDFSQAG